MPEPTRVTVVYYSSTGTTHELAREIVIGAEKAGAEVRLRKVAELAPEAAIASRPAWAEHVAATRDLPVATPDDLLWADGIVMGSPTRFGNIASQLKQFLDTLGPQWAQGQLADKVYSGFTTTDTDHGGQESTLLALYTTFHHFGGIVVAPGYTDPVKFADGNPYGSSHVGRRGEAPVDETARAAARHQGERVARIATGVKTCG
ncbi:NAD(P)H:quinone oxidoreductase [Amycolatopsis sp. NPDC005232]|uniref:NAD(P)H:quinone oxidoreductase n=1 Tax=unclassified Amycolatopsis TaxID=2618356 RepID=UPI001C69DDB1|nr:NAD(P)H:quinone oxidoreductase [Amycolatopsis sp. DSM 110486]QYN21140.1 NAD(P)H:quinone oxidoreductase [Amycolatopsis sp. DSM 110486]